MKILVIDDDVTMLWNVSNALRRWGSRVEAATGAKAGMRMLERERFDVILMDYRMPDHDAVWFMKNADIPDETSVIIMSVYVDPRAQTALQRLGVGDVLLKPFSEEELQGRLERIADAAAWRQRKTSDKHKARSVHKQENAA